MRNRAIVFVTDAAFLVATLQAALQAISQPEVARVADVLIYLVDVEPSRKQALDEAFGDRQITFYLLDSTTFRPPAGTVFHETHVPLVTLGRLSLGSLLPDQYEHILYLDGDIQIVGKLERLIGFDVEPGRIVAANDALWLYQDEYGAYWPRMKAYLAGLGIEDPRDYFNAGVLLFRRATWQEFAPRAKRFYLEHSERCLYHDQSALNAVFLGKRDVLSVYWNFLSNYAENHVDDLANARIIHFTGGVKPWFAKGPSWQAPFRHFYAEMFDRYPVLRAFTRNVEAQSAKAAQFSRKSLLRRLRSSPPWRVLMRRMRFRRYLNANRFDL